MSDPHANENQKPLTSDDFTTSDDPFVLFDDWFADAAKREPSDPNAMALATADAGGMPNVRMVLLKGHDERGFVFYTHTSSQKGQEIAANPSAAAVFHWKSLARQVRLRGPVSVISDEEADAYFASRPKMSQIGAWASKQSTPLESRLAFEKSVAYYTAKYAIGAVPRPETWVGYRISPLSIEFWHDRPFRLHDRIVFRRERTGTPWMKIRLYP
ncbi:Pyridoxamine 5'-phosphate oxidase [Rhodovulum sp. PH10]|nr:pyridoxamine 5'-phosphate oxidase [Rhodovulum sp. PH10]EJW11749.1 Pyridoxamine 5'-phosphate oxidase [Rhodovulum sp. PH10]